MIPARTFQRAVLPANDARQSFRVNIGVLRRPDGTVSIQIDSERPVVCLEGRAERALEFADALVALARVSPT